jgi:hypothetical protein
VDGTPHLELIFPHSESADGCNARRVPTPSVRSDLKIASMEQFLGRMREAWRDVGDHGHFTQEESRIRNLTEHQLREHGLYGRQLAFKLGVILRAAPFNRQGYGGGGAISEIRIS